MTDNLQTVAPIEEFDWDAYAKGEVYTKENKEKTLQSRKGCNASFCHIQLCTDSLFVRVFDFRNLFRRSSHNP